MKPYKACSCRDPETKRLLGKKCPRLGQKGHGGWYARYEAPRTADGKRRQPRIGPYATERECKAALAKAVGQADGVTALDERRTTVGEYLDRRHAWREDAAKAGAGRKRSTLDSEREAIALYLKPGLGHIKLADLRSSHIRDLYAAMRRLNRLGAESDRSELLRRLREARATRNGRALHTRPISEARIKRVHAVLHGALKAAVRDEIIPRNPAAGALDDSASHANRTRVRPLPWTDERVERWERDEHVPSPVMVWTTAQTGAFLDFAEACDDRLYPLWHLDAYWGPRRGELVGLEWHDVSLDARRLHIRQAQAADDLDSTKTESGDRQITLDDGTVSVLKAWRARQHAERLHWGPEYTDSGRVFTYEDGTALKPAYVSMRFRMLLERHAALRGRQRAGWSVERAARRHRVPVDAARIAFAAPLPPIRFHDLRHGAATMLLAAGVDDKLVSDALGHASVSFTKDVYAVVAEELAEDAARRISAFIPRGRSRAAGAISVPSTGAN